MRLLIYSQDGMGLGHLRRASNIATELVARSADAQVLVVTDSPVAPYFPEAPGVRHHKLPTLVRTGESSWCARGAGLARTVGVRARAILNAYRQLEPDFVLVDDMPAGALGELRPLLDEIADRPSRSELLLGLSDVLGEPEAIRREWAEVSGYEYLRRYDAVLVFGCREILDSESVYGLKPNARQVHYCNYVATRRRPIPPHDAEEPLVLVLGGGGASAFPIASAFLEALPRVLERACVRGRILTGPNMYSDERRRLRERATGLPVDISGGDEDAMQWLARASVVVTMAGYNSICEVLQWRRPALVVPRMGPSAEQRIRGELFMQRGLVRTLDRAGVGAASFANELVSLVLGSNVPDVGAIPPLDGAENAAAYLLERARVRSAERAGRRG